jgi:hypothetical protein
MIADQLPHPISALRRQAGLVTPRPHPTPKSEAPLVGLLEAGDPKGEVRNAWHAKEVVRSVHAIDDPELAVEFVTQLGIDLQDDSCPPEIRRFGRTITKWRRQIAAWHQAKFTNGPTEAVNNLIKRVTRVRDHELDQLPHPIAGLRRQPDWSLPPSPHAEIRSAVNRSSRSMSSLRRRGPIGGVLLR